MLQGRICMYKPTPPSSPQNLSLSYLPSLHFTVCILWLWLYMWIIYSTTTNLCSDSWLSTEHPAAGTELLKDTVSVKT